MYVLFDVTLDADLACVNAIARALRMVIDDWLGFVVGLMIKQRIRIIQAKAMMLQTPRTVIMKHGVQWMVEQAKTVCWDTRSLIPVANEKLNVTFLSNMKEW